MRDDSFANDNYHKATLPANRSFSIFYKTEICKKNKASCLLINWLPVTFVYPCVHHRVLLVFHPFLLSKTHRPSSILLLFPLHSFCFHGTYVWRIPRKFRVVWWFRKHLLRRHRSGNILSIISSWLIVHIKHHKSNTFLSSSFLLSLLFLIITIILLILPITFDISFTRSSLFTSFPHLLSTLSKLISSLNISHYIFFSLFLYLLSLLSNFLSSNLSSPTLFLISPFIILSVINYLFLIFTDINS